MKYVRLADNLDAPDATFKIIFKSQELENQSIYVTETSHKCDGIGGVNWDGSLLLADYLCGSYAGLRSSSILELGCGAGVLGKLNI